MIKINGIEYDLTWHRLHGYLPFLAVRRISRMTCITFEYRSYYVYNATMKITNRRLIFSFHPAVPVFVPSSFSLGEKIAACLVHPLRNYRSRFSSFLPA